MAKEKRSANKQPGLVPMYEIDKKTGKKKIKYWYEPPGTFKGKYAKSMKINKRKKA